jgi:hypothetical protein
MIKKQGAIIYLDQKHTVWNRWNIYLKNINSKDSKIFMILFFHSPISNKLVTNYYDLKCMNDSEGEILYDTLEEMTLAENNGDPTIEVLNRGADFSIIN